MDNAIERKIGSTVYARINSIPMPEADRERALQALYDAELLVDSFAGLVKKIEQLGSRLFMKPALKG